MMTQKELIRAANAETLNPIRQGGIDGQPYWNRIAKNFIFAPAFDFKPVDGAKSYRFELKDRLGNQHSFTADSPSDPLSPVWLDLPAGPVWLDVFAVDADGNSLGLAGHRCFYRNASFNGGYPAKKYSYAESAAKTYEYLFNLPYVSSLSSGEPDKEYNLFCYPSKLLGSIIEGMVNYAKMVPEKKDAAIAIARGAADYLIRTAIPAGEPLEYLPRTYEGTKGKAGMLNGTVMMIYPASAGLSFLTLFLATGDRKYLESARRIGDQYLRLQLPGGSWYLVLNIVDGKNLEENTCMPAGIMLFLAELARLTGEKKYDDAMLRAEARISPMRKTFNWEGQFEDVQAQRVPYTNLTHFGALESFQYLTEKYPEDPSVRAGARELMRFAEDQFVIWEQPGWVWSEKIGGERLENDTWGWYSWHTPCVLEQYRYYTPIDGSVSHLINGFLMMYDLEKNPLDLAKARALGDSITRIQHENGRVPTLYGVDDDLQNDWINCMFGTADGLKKLAEYDSITL